MSPSGDLVVVYLASPRAAGWLRWSRLDCLYASLVLLRKHVCSLPVIVFHEDYTESDKARLSSVGGDIAFEQVDFTGHESHYVDRRPGERVGTIGYCMMCRFFSGVVQRHPMMRKFSHYLRLDDDSYLIDRIADSTVERLQSFDYSYSSTFSDPYPDLWAFAEAFAKREGFKLACPYSENVPYTNFHVASLKLWRHPVIERFVDAIEAERGCVKYRWDDAQTHAVIALAMAPALGLTVNMEREFPYRHNQQCVHTGPHTIYCEDGYDKAYPWGPPRL
jgi:hypothetical protein